MTGFRYFSSRFTRIISEKISSNSKWHLVSSYESMRLKTSIKFQKYTVKINFTIYYTYLPDMYLLLKYHFVNLDGSVCLV